MKKIILASFFTWLSIFSQKMNAQDIHFSQFWASQPYLNPALTGNTPADLRFTGHYKSQWRTVPVNYQTLGLGYEQKVGEWNETTLSIGTILQYDKAGDSEMSLLQLGATAAVSQQLNEYHFLSAGLALGGGQRRFEPQALTFDEQFVDGQFDPTVATTEVFAQTSYAFADVGAGIKWAFVINDRLNFHLGAGLLHLNQPQTSFFGDAETRLLRKWNLHLEGTIRLGRHLDVLPSALFSLQGGSQERVFGAFAKYYLTEPTDYRMLAVLFGTWYRMNESAIAVLGLQKTNWQAALSYDINTSDFTTATRLAGGVEISVIYLITKVKPIKFPRSCPIF